MTSELDQIILQRNSIKDATHIDESNGLKFLLLQHTRHIWCGVAWGITSHDFTGLTPIIKTETSIQTIKVNGLEDLIEGPVALQAVLNGQTVQLSFEPWEDKYWDDFIPGIDATSTKIFFTGFHDERKVFFRIKPKTISIRGIEVPAPFEPKDGDTVWHLNTHSGCGYGMNSWSDDGNHSFMLWRTEKEIKQVVEALRKVFEVQP